MRSIGAAERALEMASAEMSRVERDREDLADRVARDAVVNASFKEAARARAHARTLSQLPLRSSASAILLLGSARSREEDAYLDAMRSGSVASAT